MGLLSGFVGSPVRATWARIMHKGLPGMIQGFRELLFANAASDGTVPHQPVQPLARRCGQHPAGLLIRLGEPQTPRRAVQHREIGRAVRHIEIRRAPRGAGPVDDAGDPGTGRLRGRHVEQFFVVTRSSRASLTCSFNLLRFVMHNVG